MKNGSMASARIWASFLVLTLVAVAVVVKMFMIQLDTSLDVEQNPHPSITAQLRSIPPTRGNILSSEGRLLAASVPMYEIRWDAKCAKDSTFVAERLDSLISGMSLVFDVPEAHYRRRFDEAARKGNRYARIQEDVTFHQLEHYQSLPLARESRFRSGLIVVKHSERQKPFGKLASRTVGVHRDNNPVGIEAAYNDVLGGREGKQWQQRIAGNVWKPLTDEYEVEPLEGLDVIATIDMNIQDAATHALERKLQEQEATWGCMIVMEVATGYVRAVTNLSRTEAGDYAEDFNYAIAEHLEPGSTFKLPVMLAALEAGVVSPQDSIQMGDGTEEVGGHEVTDSNWKEGGHGTGTAAQVFAWSSNIGMASIVEQGFSRDKQAFLDGLRKLHIHEPLGIALKGETPPRVYNTVGEGTWSGISHLQMAIGYEVQQTPLQTLAFYNAIANDGVFLQPLFVEAYARNNEVVETLPPQILSERLCHPKTIDAARHMMEMVCSPEGTAHRAFADAPYSVGGKTGTAKLLDTTRRRYFKGRYRASFVGYFPTENPVYSAIVVINDPRNGSYYGSSVAAPVFREVADRIFTTREELLHPTQPVAEIPAKLPVSLDGSREALESVYRQLGIAAQVETDQPWVNTSTQADHVSLTSRSMREGRVPNVQGMGLRDALYLLENEGLQVNIKGHGRVRSQSLPPGASIRSRQTITIELG